MIAPFALKMEAMKLSTFVSYCGGYNFNKMLDGIEPNTTTWTLGF